MNFAIKFKDLLNLAIGDPERGVLNSSVLYILLQSIIEHLKLEEQMKVLPGSEEDYLSSTFSLEKLTKALPGSGGDSLPSGPIQLKSEEKSEEREENKVYHIQFDSIKIFDQRLSAMEKQMAFLEALPSTEQLLESSHFLKTPAKDMWQMLKLKKKVEGNEEGMTKAMDTLQDLLTTICGLQADINFFTTKLEEMKKNMDKINPEEISKNLEELEDQHEKIKNLQFDMEEVKNKVLSFPERSDIMQWTTLHDAMYSQLPPDQPLSVQGKRQTAKKSVGCLISLPMEYDSLKEQLAKLDNKVQQLANQIANLHFQGSLGLIPRLETEMSILQDKIHTLQELGQKTVTCEKHLLRVEEQCNLLEKIIEALQDKMEDIKGLKLAVLQLEKEKADKIWMEEQMREKADKSALAFKANQEDLEFAKIHLNDMMFDILQKISIHEKDWRKVLEKLFFDMDSKLNHMDLDPVKKQMEHMWKFIKKSLMEGPRFDAETAAGFRKQLFDRMKCISCDRPVNVMTSPQLISVRNLDISHHDRPVSANSYEYLKQLKLREMQQLQPMTNAPERGDMPTDGQACLDNNSSLRRIVKMPSLTTIHPYGDPSVFPPPNSEVNILGVDGNLYKGRMELRGTPRSFMTEKDLAGLKVPKPPSSRKVPEYSSISNVLYPASCPRTSLTAQVLQQFSQPMMPSAILQHSPSSANLSPKIPSTNNRPTTKATTSGGPFTRKFGKSGKSRKSRSASLPTGGLNPNSREEGTNM